MLKKLLFSIFLMSTFFMVAQSAWNKTTTSTDDKLVFVESHMPSTFDLYQVDLSEIKSKLATVEKRGEIDISNSNVILNLPNGNGSFESFRILEAPIMEKELADEFEMIKTYIGQGVKDKTATLRMSIGTDGLHVMVLGADRFPLMIDPYTKNGSKYIVYASNNLPSINEFVCGVENEDIITEIETENFQRDTNATDGKMRTYRLAVACTVEYSAYHLTNQSVPSSATLAVKKAAVLSAITTTINRVTGIYEKETGVSFVLIANESSIIFINSDNFSGDYSSIANQSQSIISSTIGSPNYDIGHTFANINGGYAPGGVCSTSKARAMTGLPNPIGDFFDVDYVSHEIGHQFGALHTFNGVGGSCYNGNAATFAASEPGSGTTIMGYAGLCAGVNVQAHSDAYFHVKNLIEINNKITSTSCATIVNTGNNEPTANAGANKTIPKGTAYILEGIGIDPDGDIVTYCWEQTDTQQASHPLVSTSIQGPSYRSYPPTADSNRFMPKFTTVLNGNLLSDGSASIWEVTPTVGRILNFALTTRDNRLDGGQASIDYMQIVVSNTAGPFTVSSHTSNTTWSTGDSETITWNVAGTNANSINATTVDILLVDGTGATLATLASAVPNDGSETITVPNVTTSTSRIMIKGSNHIFYAINTGTIGVNAASTCTSTCASEGNVQFADGVTLVDFNTINNSSTGASAYSDYKSISTNIIIGSTYPLTINVNSDGNYREEVKVWIDWNQDCDFDDAGEEYDLGFARNVANGATDLSPLSVTVPATAVLGNTIMRVTSAYTGNTIGGAAITFPATACEIGFWGEVEDYTVNIQTPAATEDVSNFSEFTISPNPNEGVFNITLSAESSNDISIKIFDLIGREVLDAVYKNNESMFTKEISLSNVQAGIYLVTITDGIRSNTERIIIK